MPIDFSNAWRTGVRLVNQSIALLPNLVIALFMFIIFLVVASFCKSLVRCNGKNIRASLCCSVEWFTPA